MIKVLHILQDINSGGVERRRLSIAKKLNHEEFELKIVCINAYNDIPNQIKEEGIEIIELKNYSGPFDWSAHKKVQQIISEFKPDIIHGAVFEGVTLAAINGFIKNVPCVIIEETSDPVNRSWRGHFLMKIFGFLANYSIGVSKTAEHYLLHKVKIPTKKVKLIQNGVRSAKVYSQQACDLLREKWNITPQDFVFISVGRMNSEPQKQFKVLIQTFAKVAQVHKNAKLILVGEGNQKQEYIDLAQKLQVLDQVIFTGYQAEVDQFFAISHTFCLFSAFEAFGLVSVEAQMNKIPAIVTQVGGLKYTVVNKETGFVVQAHNQEQMHDKMMYAIQNPEQMKQMGQRAFLYVNTHFHEDQYVDNLFKFYHQIIKK